MWRETEDSGSDKMKQRIITGFLIAVVYVGTVLGTILWNPAVFDFFSVFLMLAAGLEVCNCLENKLSETIKTLFVISVIAEYVIFKLLIIAAVELTDAILLIFICTILLGIIVLNYSMFSKKYATSGGAATAFALFYPTMLLFVMLSLAYLPAKYFAGSVIMLFIASSLADTMAYFVGSALKGPKFCPEISPKKTVSGAIGGLMGGIISGFVLFALGRFGFLSVNPLSPSITVDLINWCAVGLGSAVFCEMGDLTSSYVKRVCGIKDFGHILAGHGGFMDRIDGMIVSAVYIFAYMTILGYIF